MGIELELIPWPAEIFLGELEGPFCPGWKLPPQPLPGDSQPHISPLVATFHRFEPMPDWSDSVGSATSPPAVSTSLVAFEQLQDCAEATTESIQHGMLMLNTRVTASINAALNDIR